MTGEMVLTVPTESGRKNRRSIGRAETLLAVATLAVLVYGALTTDGFLTLEGLKATVSGVGILGIVAVGMTCVTLSGSLFCLTLGSTLTISSMAFLSWMSIGVLPALVLTIVMGALVCAVQGLLIGGLAANPIVVTVGLGSLQIGVASWLTNQSTVYPPAGASYQWLSAVYAGLPLSVYVLVALVLAVAAWLSWSRTGQLIRLVGENSRAARAAGIPVTGTVVAGFVIAGGCAALGGVLLGATDGNATLLSGGDRYTYDAIAAVLVGGAAAGGGRGKVQHTVYGALFIALISNMLLLRGFGGGAQMLVTGVLVLIVLLIFQMRRRVR
ncbi:MULTISPECIES: ABC transporter permease [Micrococcaceae]|jgi:ribose/xylose/arabinose/galactoside ABC-type transport system permease subunit|uniref:ABC transporter permease n=1 Tax=Micrococcaceae TaxID=1268 RepID=UPI002096916E|nr:ABC transporter permease [Arthrobacter sp. H16F315]MDD1475377.1 ABC transporter permease [Arthrobacter sp. H16F315]